MERDSRDRQDHSAAGPQGIEDAGIVGSQDIFDEIARRFFLDIQREHGVDAGALYDPWAVRIAEAYRTAMQQLDVQVKPKGPRPKPTRTRNATVMMLLAALENGDVWIRDCLVPMREQPDKSMKPAGGTIQFDAGQFSVEVAYLWVESTRTAAFHQITAFILEHGQRVTADHPQRRWLAHYQPSPELDVFSPMLQYTLNQLPAAPRPGAWRVISSDADGRVWHWPGDGRHAQIWKDARGREL